jgi:hypothetical protein
MLSERRRKRVCPSCGESKMVRGQRVEGVAVCLAPRTEEAPAVTVPAYCDVCYGCGMVTLFVRVGEAAAGRT